MGHSFSSVVYIFPLTNAQQRQRCVLWGCVQSVVGYHPIKYHWSPHSLQCCLACRLVMTISIKWQWIQPQGSPWSPHCPAQLLSGVVTATGKIILTTHLISTILNSGWSHAIQINFDATTYSNKHNSVERIIDFYFCMLKKICQPDRTW